MTTATSTPKLNRTYKWAGGLAGIVVTTVVFIVPFIFIVLTASKTGQEASLLEFSWPTEWRFFENLVEVVQARDYILVTAFINSTILTVGSVTLMVVVSALVGYVLQRRRSRWNGLISFLVLAGLIVPPAVVPTIWVMQGLGIYKTLHGLILIEVAFGMAFCILMFRAFVATIPRELDEAAIMDGAGPIRLFFKVIFPLLRSVIVTVVVVQSVFVFNDFQNPLYFLPGDKGATVQTTLYAFQGQFSTSWNLLFMDILLITLPMLLMYIFFNRQIVAGMTSGAVKG
ncbi:carbohydrate ABC transporter permease [Demequina phytophila]|uniref:carbohydrate ABC transporter permease n=1 Tax=Demequina phytophila TaxID=1638981 RepID=UPI0007857544|nr:carbohydrate ABC transporter permease [Demequina phytophila]